MFKEKLLSKKNLSLFGSDLNEDNEIPEGKINKKNRLEKENKNSWDKSIVIRS